MDGIINVYKEKGFTSHDVVAKLRGILHQKKIGHTGTLDPDAVGVLPICLGKGTKVCDLLTEKSKTYEAVLLLGKTTDTQDISGQVLSEREVSCSREEAEEAILSFLGQYDQIPPMYSALKVNGKKLYELARAGVEVERKSRRVEILAIEILETELPRVRFRVSCSKGTYVRTLCQDIGEKLGCGGCMESLIRTRVARFFIEESLTLAEIAQLAATGQIMEKVQPIDGCFLEYPAFQSLPEADRFLYNGNGIYERQAVLAGPDGMAGPDVEPGADGKIKADRKAGDGEFVRMYDSKGVFIGLFFYDGANKSWKPKKMFYGG